MSKFITKSLIQQRQLEQLQAEVKERNEYRRLLNDCLFSLKQLKNQRIDKSITTYQLASKIEVSFKKFDGYAG